MTILHIYQNTPNGELLFYTVSDFLAFFTLVCTTARRFGIRIIGICPMYDHVHLLVEAESRERVADFVASYSRQYARFLNITIQSSGQVFNHSFGCALKTGDKAIRTACSYLYNNPGEKGLCQRAEEYRWTFLAYAVSKHPFSQKVLLEKSSKPLRRALKEVDYFCALNKPLMVFALERMFCKLKPEEMDQLTDYIICSFNCIDYDELISYYGDYETMCLAFASNQGKEYEIKESFEPGSHLVYPEISSVLVNKLGFKNVKDIFKLSPAAQTDLYRRLVYSTHASEKQIRKYLRWRPTR